MTNINARIILKNLHATNSKTLKIVPIEPISLYFSSSFNLPLVGMFPDVCSNITSSLLFLIKKPSSAGVLV